MASNRWRLLFLPALVLALWLLDRESGQDYRDHSSLRRLEFSIVGSPFSIISILWAILTSGCLLEGFFQESSVYKDVISRNQYTTVQMKGEDVLENMRVNTVGPETLHGFFWLNIITPWTEAMSFAPTLEGPGISSWDTNNDPAIRIRNLGDRSWAGAGYPPWIVRLTDPFGTFTVEEGTMENPQKLRISIDFVFPWSCTRYSTGGCVATALDWTMTLQNTPSDIVDGLDPHPLYADSVVWRRDSVTGGAINYAYEAIQVKDGDGVRLSPAAEDFVLDVNKKSYGGTLAVSTLNPDASTTRSCSRAS